MTDQMVSIVEQMLCPNIRDAIEVVEAASPMTYYRYTSNAAGAIYGYEQTILDSPFNRLRSPTPLPGLYLVGAWTNVGGGFEPSLASGRTAVKSWLEDLKQGRV